MWVKWIGSDDNMLTVARRLVATSGDECFSAQEIALDLETDERSILVELARLEETDWIVRDGEYPLGPATPETRWIVRRHASITVGKRYEVLAICADWYMVLDDRDEPILFDKSGFRIIDGCEPDFWSCETGSRRRYCGPPQWCRPGFFEDFHDRVQSVRDRFWNDLRELYPRTWEERRTAG